MMCYIAAITTQRLKSVKGLIIKVLKGLLCQWILQEHLQLTFAYTKTKGGFRQWHRWHMPWSDFQI